MPRTEVVFFRESNGSVPLVEWLDGGRSRLRRKCTRTEGATAHATTKQALGRDWILARAVLRQGASPTGIPRARAAERAHRSPDLRPQDRCQAHAAAARLPGGHERFGHLPTGGLGLHRALAVDAPAHRGGTVGSDRAPIRAAETSGIEEGTGGETQERVRSWGVQFWRREDHERPRAGGRHLCIASPELAKNSQLRRCNATTLSPQAEPANIRTPTTPPPPRFCWPRATPRVGSARLWSRRSAPDSRLGTRWRALA